MLIQFHATLAASCNLRDIKDINGIAFFAYFDGAFSQRGIQFLFPTFVYNLCCESRIYNLHQFSYFPKITYPFHLNKIIEILIICHGWESKKLFKRICQLEKLDYDPICFSVVLPEGITLTSVTIEGCAETETYYLGRDYTPRASQLNIIHLKASAFAVSLRCHP